MNSPPPQGGGFGLRLKAGSVRLRRTWRQLLKRRGQLRPRSIAFGAPHVPLPAQLRAVPSVSTSMRTKAEQMPALVKPSATVAFRCRRLRRRALRRRTSTSARCFWIWVGDANEFGARQRSTIGIGCRLGIPARPTTRMAMDRISAADLPHFATARVLTSRAML